MQEIGHYSQTLNLGLPRFGRRTSLPRVASNEAIADSEPNSQSAETGRNRTITDWTESILMTTQMVAPVAFLAGTWGSTQFRNFPWSQATLPQITAGPLEASSMP